MWKWGHPGWRAEARPSGVGRPRPCHDHGDHQGPRLLKVHERSSTGWRKIIQWLGCDFLISTTRWQHEVVARCSSVRKETSRPSDSIPTTVSPSPILSTAFRLVLCRHWFWQIVSLQQNWWFCCHPGDSQCHSTSAALLSRGGPQVSQLLSSALSNKPCPPGDAMLIVHATSPSLSQWNESRTNCISTHFCELSELSNLLHPFLEHGWPHTWTTKVSRNYGTLHIAGQPDSGTRPALRTLLTK